MNKINANTAEHFTWGDYCDGWFLAQNPNISIIQEIMQPETSELKHYHEKI